MLPKVATHVLHSTTRAVTSIQHQTYTIRNVFHQSSSSSASNSGLAPWNSPGSSHRGSNGPGSAKYGAGSRYTGYTGAGRAVTQANATISSTDGSFVQSDDQDDVPTRRPAVASRIRSNSLSTSRGGSVLKTVQLHARSRHAFAPQPAPPVLVRRNSTSAPAPTESFDPSIPAPSPQPSRRSSVSSVASSVDPASPQPPKPERTEVSHAAKRLLDARNSGNSVRAIEAVREFRQNVVNPSVREFNAALEALQATRRPGEPLNFMLDTYNDMLRHSLLPNVNTYVALIDSLTARDQEVHSAITALELRIKHRTLTGFSEGTVDQADRKRIEMLRRENNFNTAMSLFETVLSIGGNRQLSGHTYASLLRSCALNSNIDAAIHVFAQSEKRDNLQPSVLMFLDMIRVYTNAGQLPGAEEIFAEYRDALKHGGVHVPWSREGADPNRFNLLIWNQMIETYFRFDRADRAVALVDQMMAAEPHKQDLIADPPPVSTATFTSVLTGFCHIGDVETALVWFDRLLAQQGSSQDPFQPTGVPMKPDTVAWGVMIDALAVKGMVHDLNRLFSIRLLDSPRLRNSERTAVYAANMANLEALDDDQYARTLDWLWNHVLNTSEIRIQQRLAIAAEITTAYLNRKMYEKALGVLSAYMDDFIKASTVPKHNLGVPPSVHEIQDLQLNFTDKLYQISQGNIPYAVPMQLARLAGTLRIAQPPSFVPFFLHSYALSRASETLPIADMALRDWELLLMAANTLESASNSENPPQAAIPDFAFQGLPSLIRDFATYNVALGQMSKNLVRHVLLQLTQRLGADDMLALMNEAGFTGVLNDPDRYVDALNEAIEGSASETSVSDSGYASDAPLYVDSYLSKKLMDEIKLSSRGNVRDALLSVFAKFRKAVELGRAPYLNTFALLIQWLGRMGHVEEMHFTYSVAQRVLQGLKYNKVDQTNGWFDVENAMIIGLAHFGDVESAHQHRRRILANGGAPTADAYGALIYNVKDTTDDASNALELFRESQTYNINPNQYLYNNIISKLARARKADYAIELFQQMKSQGVQPTSVTFGAVIGACARVGDIHSAELLFSEMTRDKTFKPRIPPYNTMMQMYTTTKPDRARVLYFYEEMRKVKISPSAHTYKLLMDAYGSIEPVDLEGMLSTLETLRADKNVSMQGTHFASLLNAYGCVSKDLDKAVEVFNNMNIARDSIVYEAMFNVLIVHRRADLIHEYITKMHLEGVRMTAYIANVLIKGYSLLDNIEEARKVFESLDDPPEGVAAPNNHAPHSPSEESPTIDQSTPVYREPSTWEAMIRAELGSGNRDGALALLERLRARQYPEAVFNRISGILVDHSQVPL